MQMISKREYDKIMLHGLKFYGYHGALPEEQRLGQSFIVDLELWGDFRKAADSDELQDALDYSRVYALVKEVVEGPALHLLECLSQRISEAVLTLPQLQKVKVCVKKPGAPLPGPLDYAAVEIVRWKNEE